MSSLVYHPAAETEALEAFDWYASRSHDAARRFGEELIAAERQVLSHPTRWASYLHGTRRFSLKRYPYALVYLQHGEGVYIVAVAHLHRRPGYWRKRLD